MYAKLSCLDLPRPNGIRFQFTLGQHNLQSYVRVGRDILPFNRWDCPLKLHLDIPTNLQKWWIGSISIKDAKCSWYHWLTSRHRGVAFVHPMLISERIRLRKKKDLASKGPLTKPSMVHWLSRAINAFCSRFSHVFAWDGCSMLEGGKRSFWPWARNEPKWDYTHSRQRNWTLFKV